MHRPRSRFIFLTWTLLCSTIGVLAMPRPEPTSPPTRVELPKRGLSSWASSVAQGLPTDVASGILPAFQGLPSPDDIKEQLNLTDDSINQLPIQVLNIPSYANWTSSGWNVRIHGQAYRQPPANNETLDRISSIFIADLEVSSLNETGLQQSRNMSASMLALPAGDVNLNFTLTSPISNASLLIDFPVATDSRGEFDQFIQLNAQDVPTNTSVMSWPLYTVNVESGNTTMWFVPPEGISIVSDIDDILRFTQIYVPQQGLYNSFAVPFVPWSDMPNVYAAWAQGNPNYHFHYLTTTPEQFTRPYVDFQNKYYPLGSFDDRPLNLTTVDQIFSIRKVNLLKFYETFPNRKIVLVADTSNGDVMSSYPKMAMDYPNQTACILIRNTSATDPQNHFPYNTKGFKDLPKEKYMFFRTTDDIRNLNFANGDCLNSSVPQNVTFEYQGNPFDALGSAMGTVSTIPRTTVIIILQFIVALAIGLSG